MLELKILGYVAMAMFLGGVVGFERELADKPAGMRTHMLVAGAAALLVLLGELLVTHFGAEFGAAVIRTDPIRIIAAIVTGVAFLGAGTIIRQGQHSVVKGLTTAADLLFTSAIGICVAVREIILAVGVTVLALATLRLVGAVEVRLRRRAGLRQPGSGNPDEDQ